MKSYYINLIQLGMKQFFLTHEIGLSGEGHASVKAFWYVFPSEISWDAPVDLTG